MKMWDMNRLSDEVIIVVVKYGAIEDVLAKERISKRIGVLVSSVVSKKTRFTTDCDPIWTGTAGAMWPRTPLTMDDVMSTLKRMPLLTSLSGFGIENWDLVQTQQLAIVNPNIVCFHSVCNFDKHHKVLKYIEHVKELNPNYKGDGVMCTFDYRHSDYRALVQRVPDLHLKLRVHGWEVKELNPDRICTLSLYDSNDKLPHRVIFQNVTMVDLITEYEFLSDFASLPNLENLTTHNRPCFESQILLRLSMLYPYLSSDLRYLKINAHLAWHTDDTLPLKAIIDNIPLKSLKIEYPRRFPTREVLQFVIESPIRTLEELIIPHLEIKKDDKGRTKMLAHLTFTYDMEQLTDLIRRFKKVDQVSIYWSSIEDHQPLDVEGIKESFRQIEMTDRRRKLDLLMIPGF